MLRGHRSFVSGSVRIQAKFRAVWGKDSTQSSIFGLQLSERGQEKWEVEGVVGTTGRRIADVARAVWEISSIEDCEARVLICRREVEEGEVARGEGLYRAWRARAILLYSTLANFT